MERILGIHNRSCRPAISSPEALGHGTANSRILKSRDCYRSPGPLAPRCSPGTFPPRVGSAQNRAVRIVVSREQATREGHGSQLVRRPRPSRPT